MFHPAHIDGQSLVILRRRRSPMLGAAFIVVTSGRLEYDGETLNLVGDGVNRVITDQERAVLMVVRPDTNIVECRGFHLFLLEEAEE